MPEKGVTGWIYIILDEIMDHSFFFLFIEFVQVTLVNKTIQVAGAQFYNIPSVHYIVCLPPLVKFLSITIYPSTHPMPPILGNHHTVVCVHDFFFSIPPPSTPPSNLPTAVNLLFIYGSVSISWIILKPFYYVTLGRGGD